MCPLMQLMTLRCRCLPKPVRHPTLGTFDDTGVPFDLAYNAFGRSPNLEVELRMGPRFALLGAVVSRATRERAVVVDEMNGRDAVYETHVVQCITLLWGQRHQIRHGAQDQINGESERALNRSKSFREHVRGRLTISHVYEHGHAQRVAPCVLSQGVWTLDPRRTWCWDHGKCRLLQRIEELLAALSLRIEELLDDGCEVVCRVELDDTATADADGSHNAALRQSLNRSEHTRQIEPGFTGQFDRRDGVLELSQHPKYPDVRRRAQERVYGRLERAKGGLGTSSHGAGGKVAAGPSSFLAYNPFNG